MLRTLLLLAVALLLTPVRVVAAPALNGRPPDFSLGTAGGETLHLRDLIGHDRLLIAFRPAVRDLRAIESRATDFRDRDLRVLVIVPPTSSLLRERWAAPVTVLADPGDTTSAAYGASTPRSFLVGKDGGVKGVYGDVPGATELFATIDAMPMRQQERRARGR